MPEYAHEIETCLKCGWPVDMLVDNQRSSQRHVFKVILEAHCRRGCTGRVVDAPGAPG
jgi:hypothetical protein